MALPDFDFSRLNGFELVGVDFTSSRLVIIELLGPYRDVSGNDSRDALNRILLSIRLPDARHGLRLDPLVLIFVPVIFLKRFYCRPRDERS